MNNPYLAPAPEPQHDAMAGSPYGGGGPGRSDDRAGVTEMTVEMLRQTRPWVVFLSVMSFIGSAFMAFGGVVMIGLGAIAPSNGGPIPTSALGLVYLPMAALYIFPALKLWGFGSAINRLVASRSSGDLEVALGQQKSFWKFAGIVTIVMIALYGLFFIGMIAVGVSAASRHSN